MSFIAKTLGVFVDEGLADKQFHQVYQRAMNIADEPRGRYNVLAVAELRDEVIRAHELGKPVRPHRLDLERVERGDFVRAGGDATCGVCKHILYDHPPVPGITWLRRRCDGTFVKL